MISNDVYPVPFSEKSSKAISDGRLYPNAQTQVVITRKTRDNFPAPLAAIRTHATISPVVKKNAAKSPVFPEPKILSITLISLLGVPPTICSPPTPAIEEVPEEEG